LDSGNHLLPERDPAWPRFLAAAEAFLAGDTGADITTVERRDAAGPMVQAKPRV
jgi:hypothetical protein